MASPKRPWVPGAIYHITNRGNHQEIIFRENIDYIVERDEFLSKYNRLFHEQDFKHFKELDKQNQEISKYIIDGIVTENFPDYRLEVTGSPVATLKREHNKTLKIKSIRKLFEEIPDLITTLKPCFLMSPLSVSTFLSKGIEFDTVIFDEASQVFTEDAMVAIYRGKQLIVVGDSKQMPPSNFFKTMENSEEE